MGLPAQRHNKPAPPRKEQLPDSGPSGMSAAFLFCGSLPFIAHDMPPEQYSAVFLLA
jgi:hypothetical protein